MVEPFGNTSYALRNGSRPLQLLLALHVALRFGVQGVNRTTMEPICSGYAIRQHFVANRTALMLHQ
jgi:hypothetical protein